MTEFVFRNLSVKLFPPEGETGEDEGDARVRRLACNDLQGTSQLGPLCQNYPVPSGLHQPCWWGPYTIPCVVWPITDPPINQCFGNAYTVPDPWRLRYPPAAGDVRSELGVLKENLRQQLANVEAAERDLERQRRPRSVEEIDMLKAQLLDAVSELDRQRADLERREPSPE